MMVAWLAESGAWGGAGKQRRGRQRLLSVVGMTEVVRKC